MSGRIANPTPDTVESCGARDDSPRWNLGRANQGDTIWQLRFHHLQIERARLSLLYPEKLSVLLKFMITKKSSGPEANCLQIFKDQCKVNHAKEEKEVRVTRKLVPTLSSFRLKEHPCTHKEPFLLVRGNGRSFAQLHQINETYKLLQFLVVHTILCEAEETRLFSFQKGWQFLYIHSPVSHSASTSYFAHLHACHTHAWLKCHEKGSVHMWWFCVYTHRRFQETAVSCKRSICNKTN